ncbi:NapC/NirT family cytochrome c [Candidatus Aerophobetes bacterium]|nr:NapC/NirT family cytochrome c [Candidatus Aerophobetes bacterium]
MSISKKTLILIAVPIVIVILAVAGMEITSKTSFCITCHNMKVYYETLQTSSHQDVDCVTCHIAPGWDNYMRAKLKGLSEVAVYTIGEAPLVPHARVEDASCLRCHAKGELREKTVDFKKGDSF